MSVVYEKLISNQREIRTERQQRKWRTPQIDKSAKKRTD